MPCWGNCDLISRRITASAARSASVTGSKSWAMLLLSIESDVRKNGRKGAAEGGEVDDRHLGIPGRRAGRVQTVVLPSSIWAAAHDDPAFSVGILDTESP